MKGFEDVAITRFDYSALDKSEQPVRVRLNSTAVGVKPAARYRSIMSSKEKPCGSRPITVYSLATTILFRIFALK